MTGVSEEPEEGVLKDGKIYKWDSEKWIWEELKGKGARVAVTKDGDPWVVNQKNEIYRRKGGNWEKLPGTASDIGIGGDNVVFAIGTDKEEGGDGTVRKWYNELYKWSIAKGKSGVAVDVSPDGVAYVVNSQSKIYRQKGDAWQELPGRAIDIAVGNDGTIYACQPPKEGKKDGVVHKWDEDNWEWVETKGMAVKITVNPEGTPYVINSKNDIYYLKK